jgi:uncharacterized protein YjiS (DUF1127 family)
MATPCEFKSGVEAAAPRDKSGAVARLFKFLARASEVSRQRRALLQLGDMALKDFGASRADAWQEGGRPWWDLPDSTPKR